MNLFFNRPRDAVLLMVIREKTLVMIFSWSFVFNRLRGNREKAAILEGKTRLVLPIYSNFIVPRFRVIEPTLTRRGVHLKVTIGDLDPEAIYRTSNNDRKTLYAYRGHA